MQTIKLASDTPSIFDMRISLERKGLSIPPFVFFATGIKSSEYHLLGTRILQSFVSI